MRFLGLKLEKRPTPPPTFMRILAPIFAILMSFMITSILLFFSGVDLTKAFGSLLGTLASKTGLAETIVKATPLLLVGLGISIAFRCRVYNIGGEGQLIMGAIAAAWAGITFTGVPTVLLIPLILILSFILGGLWGGIAGVLKAKFRVNEIIVTIMMNYVALYFMMYLLFGPMGVGGAWPRTPLITSSAWLLRLVPGARLHSGIFLALLFAVLVWILLFRTVLGYRIRSAGANPEAARYGGINQRKMIVIAMLLSGGLIGVAGANEVMGVHRHLLPAITAGYGYTGILVAWLGRLHPVGITITAILFSALIVGMQSMFRVAIIPAALIWAIVGLTIIFVLAGELFIQYRIRRT